MDTSQLENLADGLAPADVMLTIGGNDIGFAEVLAECAVAIQCAMWPAFTTRMHSRISELELECLHHDGRS